MGERDEHQLAPRIKSTACECSYPSRNRRVRVTESYIRQLVAENKRLRSKLESQPGPPQRLLLADEAEEDGSPSATIDEAPDTPESSHEVPLDGQPWFVDVDLPHTPTPINEAADTAFATRLRQVLSHPDDPPCAHLPHTDYASDDTIMALAETHTPWPKPSRARLLMDVALMHVSRGYHIVRRSVVLDALEKSQANPGWRDPVMSCKLRALFALGDLCSSRFVLPGREFPGLGHFAQATKILNYLDERPTLDLIEIRLMLSLYSFTLNRVYAAYTLAGAAVRMAVIMGLHLNIPATQLSDPVQREHRNRVWWTAYIFDRMWATKLGCPPAIQDEDVKVDLPSTPAVSGNLADDFGFAGYYVACVKLGGIAMNTVRSIYTGKDQANTLFNKVQQRVKQLKAWVEELPPSLHMDTTLGPNPNYHNYDLLSLHLTPNQTIILATRPILLYGLLLHNRSSPPKHHQIPPPAKPLIDACIRCARHSCRILSESWVRGAFPALYHDLTQYLFSALTVLAVSSLLGGPDGGAGDREWFGDSVRLLAQVRDSGNLPAREFARHAELIAAAVRRAEERGGHGDDSVGREPAGDGVAVTAETALAEASLQDLLMQPTVGMQLPDAGFDLFASEDGLYWSELDFPVQSLYTIGT
ncbi:fungal-specific transcription factor domain-containing protein [Parachaetomium inaequale]|uniref:Fungal-specific transcription factor domain-containing protein n=1 Tax=Parachaetomium inaequale TaxID=2588326 RepID=A0AAN6SR22_9PEZI|nr:fungal-specific transcription factor domain-containing protein [Parachaetomium inaequale]